MDAMNWTEFVPTAIEGALQDFAGTFGPIAAALASVGVLAMALIEFGKKVLGLRRWWNEQWIRNWLKRRAPGSITTSDGTTVELSIDVVLAQLHELATAGDQWALYDQRVEKLAGQINAALQMALETPDRYRALIITLARNADSSDFKILFGGRPDVSPKEGDEPSTERREEVHRELERYVEARNRIASHFQRSLDGIMIAMTSQWSRRLHVWSVVVSGLFIFLGAGVFGGGSTSSLGNLLLWILVAVAGGLLAPMINDFSKVLKPKRG